MNISTSEFSFMVLTQAVTFLFSEAKNILAERRRRRQEMDEADDLVSLPNGIEESDKDGVLKLRPVNFDEEIKKDIENILKIIEIQREHRRKAEIKINKLGGILFVPPNVRVELEYPEDELLKYSQKLKVLLEKVYDCPIYIDGLE